MNEPEPVRVETEIAEFASILSTGPGEEAPVVVGGHAVNLWSEYYLSKGVGTLARYVPFTSKDLDLVGNATLLQRLHEALKGELRLSEPRSPVLGRIEIPRPQGGVLRVEVLHTVNGLSRKDLARTMDLLMDGLAARVLLPHLVLKAKIGNVAGIDQDGRNDIKHVRMMLLCVRAFIAELAAFVVDGKAGGRPLVNLLEETLEIVTGPAAAKAASLWGFDFSEVWPMDDLKGCGSEKVARWLAHRLP